MKKLSKKSYLLISIGIITFICIIGINSYRKPITFHKNVNAIIKPNPRDDARSTVILRETNVEINAEMYRGVYAGIFDNKINFNTDLKGKIIIDNKEYTFIGSAPGKSKHNWFLSYVDNKDKYSGFILYDLNTVEIFMK